MIGYSEVVGAQSWRSRNISSSFNLSEKHEISGKSLTTHTGHPGIEAFTYSCPKIKRGDKTICRNITFRLVDIIISNRKIDKKI